MTEHFRLRSTKTPTVAMPRETDEQQSFIRWFRYQFPKQLIFSIPNGAYLFGSAAQRAGQMRRLKAEGLVPGVPDLFAPGVMLFIEFKRAQGGRLTADQVAMHDHLRAFGYTVIVAFGADDAMRQVREWMAA